MDYVVFVAVILGILAFHVCTCWFSGNLYYWLMYGDNNPDKLSCLTWPIDFVIEMYWRIYDKIHEKEGGVR